MNKIIAAGILLVISFHSEAQLTFIRTDTIKVSDSTLLSNAWAGGLNFCMLSEIDLNGDGIMDLVIYEPGGVPGHDRIMPFLNHGTAGHVDYHYAPQYISHFPDIRGFLITYDYNHDGKMDLFSLSVATNAGIMVYRNDYTDSTGLQFTLVKDPILAKYHFGSLNVFASQVSVPALSDVDNDGDMDIISWPPYPDGTLEYQKGIAVDSGWSLDSLRFFNVPSNYCSYCTGSLCWGGFILEVGTSNNRVSSFGDSCMLTPRYGNINFDSGTMFNDDTQSVISLFDVEGTGLKDAFIGGYADNNLVYVHNAGTPLKDSMDYQVVNFPDYDVPVNLPSFPYSFFIDVNNDGLKDLIVTSHSVSNYRGVLYYKNIGTAGNAVFQRQPHMLLQEDMIDVGSGAAPQLFDYDGDGLPDLLIGNESYHDTSGVDHKGITLYKDTGTASHPAYKLITRDYADIDELNGLQGTICPTFGDLNGDGAIDMIIGESDGFLQYFQNTAGAGNAANLVLAGINYSGIDVGENSAPQLYDLNHDGLLDLIVGNKSGIIKYYENIGTANAPQFNSKPTKDTLGGIIIQNIPGVFALSDTGLHSGYAAPFFYNDGGVDKLILGTQIGKLYVFDSISVCCNFHLADSLINGEEGQFIIPYIGDINHDGHPDMLVGNYNGGVSLFMNTDTSIILGNSTIQPTILSSFTAYPNPASDELHLTFYHAQNAHPFIEMVNNIGQTVYQAAVTASSMTLQLGGFANGIYLVRFSSDDNRQSQKIVVRR